MWVRNTWGQVQGHIAMGRCREVDLFLYVFHKDCECLTSFWKKLTNCKCLPALSYILGALRFPRILLLQRACLTRFRYAHSFRGVDQSCLPSQLYMAFIVSCVILPQCLSSLHSYNLDVSCSHLFSQWIWLCSHNTDLTTSALRELTHLISLL